MTVLGEIRRGGLGRKEPRRIGLVFFLALSFFMVVFSLYGAQASVFEKAREGVLDFFEPVLSVVGAPVRWVNDQVGDVQDYFRLHAENKRLQEENAELRIWMEEALSLRRQISYYETILETKLPEPATFVDAKVIGENAGPYDHALILSAGRRDGVKTGSAVVDDGGLLGHVVTAGDGAARVLLLTDYNSRVPVFIEDRAVEALLAGRSTGRPTLEYFADSVGEPLTPGLRVITSGAGGRLPRGIAVGEIAAVNDGRVTVSLYANYRTPDLVRVIDYQFPQDVEAPVETAEGDEGSIDG
ncbi:rod shape-determining protein MreC [Parvularcula sp. LCG005]|uniref:rod shape-determining protein MreC n=1 Tax=Parvularcula sp. LCG005 TaxID=3078805 RepID=UPI0029431FFC|nr:rod shape-determining protein MreC [Parvularcula sp. LCG005]WOI54115.1 rod shape-determining protein MreC [Parvularcula sp. LCG005]